MIIVYIVIPLDHQIWFEYPILRKPTTEFDISNEVFYQQDYKQHRKVHISQQKEREFFLNLPILKKLLFFDEECFKYRGKIRRPPENQPPPFRHRYFSGAAPPLRTAPVQQRHIVCIEIEIRFSFFWLFVLTNEFRFERMRLSMLRGKIA